MKQCVGVCFDVKGKGILWIQLALQQILATQETRASAMRNDQYE